MQWYELLFSAISLRSFPVLWYWIALAGFWTVVTWRTWGVPPDVLMRAGDDRAAAEDMVWLVAFRLRRRQAWTAWRRVPAVAAAAFVLAVLAGLSVAGAEAAQALLLMVAPLAVIEVLNLRLEHRWAEGLPPHDAIARSLIWHRFTVQAIAGISIFLTLIWGVWRNLSLLIGGA